MQPPMQSAWKQVDVAKRHGDRLIPYRKNYPEAPKNGHTYLLADRGAFAFDPQVGVYEDCHELDFSSFFPNLMVKRNLSPETVLCDCCDPRDPTHPPQLFVPAVGYHVCRRRDGINGETLARLIERRRVYKQRRKTMPDELDKWQARSDILKMELVCSFGYQGHKNHRLGRIEVHESINAWARHDLLKTASIAREHGFDILHGLSDSLWLKRFVKDADPEELSRRVEREIGIPFELQGRYKWLVLLPNKTSNAPHADPVGALTRFYGCYDGDVMPTRSSGHQKLDYIRGGRVKVRGIELRQHSTCNVIRRIQEVVLERLADADDLAGSARSSRARSTRPAASSERSATAPSPCTTSSSRTRSCGKRKSSASGPTRGPPSASSSAPASASHPAKAYATS
jgi:DNA polymerase elongation subunit (family B)